jgi:Bax protein
MSLFARSKRSGCSIDMINNQITLSKINKYFKKNKVSISEIQKYLKKKGFTISKKKDVKEESNLGSLTRTFLSSLIIIAIFSVAPLVSDLTKKNQIFSKDFENNSKNNLKALIENKEVKIDEDLNNKFLFDDVLQFDEQPVDTVRLSASTIEELFKSTDYNLNDVRKNKLVKPISLTLLPSEIKQIENAKKRKIYLFK